MPFALASVALQDNAKSEGTLVLPSVQRAKSRAPDLAESEGGGCFLMDEVPLYYSRQRPTWLLPWRPSLCGTPRNLM